MASMTLTGGHKDVNAKSIVTISFISSVIGATVASLFFLDNNVMFMVTTALVTFSVGVAITVALVVTKRNGGPR